MKALTTHFSTDAIAYTGVELRPHFFLTRFGLKGSAIGAFIGPCRVATEHLVDWEDRMAQDRIEAASMVHFIGEFFGASLREGVLMQRLFMASVAEELNARMGGRATLYREGDDLFLPAKPAPRKLSVSIVTASPVSQLLHVGINIDPAGAPVPAVGVGELGLDAKEWVPAVLKRFSEELEGIEWACAKVRPVM